MRFIISCISLTKKSSVNTRTELWCSKCSPMQIMKYSQNVIKEDQAKYLEKIATKTRAKHLSLLSKCNITDLLLGPQIKLAVYTIIRRLIDWHLLHHACVFYRKFQLPKIVLNSSRINSTIWF